MSARLCRNPRCRSPLERRADQCGYKGALGYCRACLGRWNYAGRPDTGPPDPVPGPDRNTAWRERLAAERELRLSEYASLRSRRFTNQGAALRMGIAVRTAQAYGRELRLRQQEEVRAA